MKNRGILLQVVREAYKKRESRADVRDAIKKRFGVTYDLSCVKRWVEQAHPEMLTPNLADQKIIMDRWHNELEDEHIPTRESQSAEALYRLFTGAITNEEFKEMGF